ncbi:Allantoicase [Arachnomyces sp. PD_36]|nr:Allantoicase [Arachnomyces sp. PD_36]
MGDLIPPDAIDSTFSRTTNLASSALNSSILSFSDEYFAAASNLLTPTRPIHKPGVFVHTGAWYDGWETRRHNPEPYDWVIIKLGVGSGVVEGVEVDTAYFVGNYAESVEAQGTYAAGDDDAAIAKKEYAGWETILPKTPCGPSQRHAWEVDTSKKGPYTHIRLLMYPDGGIARFRLYGHAIPPPLPSTTSPIKEELSSALMGSLAVSASNQHFTPASNLILPGRGKDMGDGWETARSRVPGHTDWAIIRLGLPGTAEKIVVDTKDFRGNFPRTVRVHGLLLDRSQKDAVQDPAHDDAGWIELLSGEKPCKADTEHVFEGGDIADGNSARVFSHLKLTMIPDGGVKRFRVFGERSV